MIFDVAACSAILTYSAAKVGESSGVGRSSPFTLIGEGLETFCFITSVFSWLIFGPTCYADMLRRVVLFCIR